MYGTYFHTPDERLAVENENENKNQVKWSHKSWQVSSS
jgi:hypothetical protein